MKLLKKSIWPCCFAAWMVATAGVVAQNGAGPTAPTGVGATMVDCSSIRVSWTPSSAATPALRGYRIWRNGVYVTEVPANLTSFIDRGLSEGRAYSFRVSAKNVANQESIQSDAAVAQTAVCDDRTPPKAPSGLTATALNCATVTLAWKQVTDEAGSGVRGYRIMRNGTYVTEVAASALTFEDVGVSPGRTYVYTVSAKDRSNNESPESAAVQVPVPVCTAGTPPTIPTKVTATNRGCGRVDLTWFASTDLSGQGLRGYRLYRKGAYVAEVSAGQTSYSDLAVSPNATYAYEVVAVDRVGTVSARSVAVTITTASCP